MASELRVNTLKDASGNNSVGMSTVAGGVSKSFVSFSMASTTPKDSFNFSSLIDRATGKFTVNLSSAHTDANYGCVGYTNAYAGNSFQGGMALGLHVNFEVTSTASAYAFASYTGSGYEDATHNTSATFGDLA
tara:strand:+ start:285 stop:683 length:399 start_codon:yes stop_codon:yes gene_type:complete